MALLGVRRRGKTWGDCINLASFGNPGYSTIKFVLASIYVNYETSQYRIGFLIIVVIWQKCNNRASTEHANKPFRKTKLGSKKLGITSLQEPNIGLNNCHWRNFLLQ